MKHTIIYAICLFAILTMVWSASSEEYWPQWRGPKMTGVAPDGNPPVEWGEDKNVRWKIEIPGKGHASPIIWGNKIFILTSIDSDKVVEPKPEAEQQQPQQRMGGRRGGGGRGGRGGGGSAPVKVQKFTILAISRQDGKVLWQQTAREEAASNFSRSESTWASYSPVTDGEHIYAYFGSHGLYCYDMQGNLIWEKDLGDMTTSRNFGEGGSPALYGNFLVINWDHEGQSFIAVFDKKTGDEIWRKDRDEGTSWATPIVVEHNGKPQVITSATNRIRSYALATGTQIWESGGMTRNAIPSPVAADGMVYLTSGFRGNALLAIRLDKASGDVTNSNAIVWSHNENTPYVPSPLLYGDTLYFLLENKTILSCLNSQTGQVYYGRQQLEGLSDTFVSPVGAAERVYITDKNGNTLVIRRGQKLEVLAANSLDDNFTASPAIVDKEIYLRGHKYLYCIAQD